MKRLHINIAVGDLDESIRFYSTLFATEPTVRKPDYAKWMLDDPRVNLAISTHGARKGLDHLGIQVDDDGELREIFGRLKAASAPMIDQGETTCCYARSDKHWSFDPEGIAWETFRTLGESAVYGESTDLTTGEAAGACCAMPSAEAGGAAPADSCCDAGGDHGLR